jgi:hypothetical protein
LAAGAREGNSEVILVNDLLHGVKMILFNASALKEDRFNVYDLNEYLGVTVVKGLSLVTVSERKFYLKVCPGQKRNPFLKTERTF